MVFIFVRRVLLLLAASLFAGLGALAYVNIPDPCQGMHCPPPIACSTPDGCDGKQPSLPTAETEQTQAALEALSSGDLDKEAGAIAEERGIVPAGDTCGMRRPNVMPALPRKTRAALAAASMAASPAVRFEILDNIEATEPKAAWRIRLEKSEVARRVGDLARASEEADAALAMNPPGSCVADAWFNKAVASDGDTRTDALIAAVESDPGHYNAWARLAIDLMKRMDAGVDADECDAMVARIVKAIVHLDKLAKTDAQLSRLERLANTSSRGSSSPRALLLAMIQERTMRATEAIGTYATLVAGGGSTCVAPIELVASSRLSELRRKEKNREKINGKMKKKDEGKR